MSTPILRGVDITSHSTTRERTGALTEGPVRGGPFETWGGLWFLPRDQTFFFDTQLKRTIFFRPYQKQTIFFSAVKLKKIFFTIYFI